MHSWNLRKVTVKDGMKDEENLPKLFGILNTTDSNES